MTASLRTFALAVLAAAVIGACVTATPGTPGPTGPIADRANAQRTVWRGQGIRSYSFAIERQCFCPEEWRGPFDVTVVEGGATLVQFKGGVAVQDRVAELPKTMEALFDLIVANAPTEPDVAYDDRFGFPLRIALDPMKNAIDDEVTYVISNFRVTTPGG
jgi:hypothetical protein